MLIRSYAYLAASSIGLTPSLAINASAINTSCHTIKRRHEYLESRRTRGYATISGDQTDTKRDEPQHEWPETPKGHACPTPYQIFAMTRNETYTKARFYSLVKLYHPDRGSLGPVCPHHVRLERYRLIVAAHNILSDPSKRSAYDRLGMGWQGRPEVKTANNSSSSTGPFSHNWQEYGDTAWSNATWEDWERFHARRDARRAGLDPDAQRPVYLSNVMFLGLVFVIIFCGAAMNYGRAHDNGKYFVEQRDLIHDRAAKELRRVRMEKQTMGNRDDRVEWFMRQRDATLGVAGSDPETMRQELADRVLPNRDVCRSDAVTQESQSDGG